MLQDLADFLKKDRKTKVTILRKFSRDIFIVICLFALPGILITVHASMMRGIHAEALNKLPIEQRWKGVEDGTAHIVCTDYATETLKARGFDPDKSDGISFAIENGLCEFVPNE